MGRDKLLMGFPICLCKLSVSTLVFLCAGHKMGEDPSLPERSRLILIENHVKRTLLACRSMLSVR